MWRSPFSFLFNTISPLLSTTTSRLRMTLSTSSLSRVSLDAAGLVALADLTSIAERTALRGDASWLDVLFLAPGIHRQQQAADINRSEYPICGAMTSGYVFRVENQATVAFLQKVGKTGHLTVIQVDSPDENKNRIIKNLKSLLAPPNLAPSVFYLLGISFSIVAVALVSAAEDWWGLGVLAMLIGARLINTIVIKRRAQPAWKGAKEPGVMGDLLVLLSQDRWVRIQGTVDDLKVVTAGQWLRDEETVESFFTAFATLLVYTAAALVPNTSNLAALILILLTLSSAGLLGLSNSLTKDLTMFGRTLRVSQTPKQYPRRLVMAEELIAESQRRDWAVRMGLVLPDKGDTATQVSV
ncbi:hypothetical protein BKA70DRAFT_1278275 [Coprinopsis sp. MPI-PUGE-AT-0042]|nr:hypothetical protein BKA70DRAFT_1278275 [Coprinopsis sp. MPI-PUGE-AT-0042]